MEASTIAKYYCFMATRILIAHTQNAKDNKKGSFSRAQVSTEKGT
jgi:hypothetical protein